MSEEPKQHPTFKPQSLQISASHQFTGPLPPPEVLAKYNEALPSAAEGIMAMAESQLRHRHAIEKQIIDSACTAQLRGPIFGFIVCMSAIVGGVGLIHTGKDAYGLAAIVAALAGLAVVFIYGKSKQQKELRDKSESLIQP